MAWHPDPYELTTAATDAVLAVLLLLCLARLWRHRARDPALALTVGLFLAGAVNDAFGRGRARRWLWILVAMAFGFVAVRQLVPGSFLVFVLYEAVVMGSALFLYARLARRGTLPGAGLMTAGIVVTLVAAAIQATGFVRIHLVWPFDHNGVFHLVQMLALPLLLAGLTRALEDRGSPCALPSSS